MARLLYAAFASTALWIVTFALTLGTSVTGHNVDPLTPQERLGKLLFFDTSLSARGNQSCASCHGPGVGWTGPDSVINQGSAVYEGSIAGRFGDRKPPSAAYATFAPRLHMMRPPRPFFMGGNFWDGRATGEVLGSPAADQAMGPFLNPVEQALPDADTLVRRVCTGPYAELFVEVWGQGACSNPERGYQAIALAIAAYEASSEVNQFSSKYDMYLAGHVDLTPEEDLGLRLFAGKALCSTCHPHRPSAGGRPPLFTDFSFENLGVPANPDHPRGSAWRDEGLGGYLATTDAYRRVADGQRGRHRVPTLRNVDKRPHAGFVKAYGHNGYFKSLASIVHFYNTRDLLPTCGERGRAGVDCWPAPEVAENLNTRLVGALGLTASEEAALVAFLRTLSDGHD